MPTGLAREFRLSQLKLGLSATVHLLDSWLLGERMCSIAVRKVGKAISGKVER